MRQAALRVAHDLYPHWPWSRLILFELPFFRPERGERFLAGEAERLAERFPVAGDAHALAAPARRRLDDHREADLFGDLEPRVHILDRPRRARHGGHLELLRQLSRGRLMAHLADLVAARADERDVRRLDDVGEFGVFSEKPIPGMDEIGRASCRERV